MKKHQNTKQQRPTQFKVGTPTHILRMVRRIQAAAKVAGLRAELEYMGELLLLRVLHGNYTHMIIDIIDVPIWNLDDLPQPLAAPTVKLYIRDISWLSMRFTSALLADKIAHDYAFADPDLDAHIALALNPAADIEAEDANIRIAQIAAYRRRTRRRILEQGLPAIGTPRSHNGYHRGNGNGHTAEARTAFGRANQRLHRSGVRVYAN